jgi:hypothetical protein
MKSLRANVTLDPRQDRRSTRRWQVDLLVSLPGDQGGRRARIRNLSEAGMMLETDAELAVGDLLAVELNDERSVEATIVWRQEHTFGCRFLADIPPSLVAALILRAPLEATEQNDAEPVFEEIPVGLRPTFGELAAWKTNFEQKHAGTAMRLVGFRQTEGGLLIAIVSGD